MPIRLNLEEIIFPNLSGYLLRDRNWADNIETRGLESIVHQWSRRCPAFEDATRLAKEFMRGYEDDFLDSTDERFREPSRRDLP